MCDFVKPTNQNVRKIHAIKMENGEPPMGMGCGWCVSNLLYYYDLSKTLHPHYHDVHPHYHHVHHNLGIVNIYAIVAIMGIEPLRH